jgi:hypothetical protein
MDRFEEILPAGRDDVDVAAYVSLISQIPDQQIGPKAEALRVLMSFSQAVRPQCDSPQTYLGRCFALYRDQRDQNDCVILRIDARAGSFCGGHLGMECDRDSRRALVDCFVRLGTARPALTRTDRMLLAEMCAAAEQELAKEGGLVPLEETTGHSLLLRRAVDSGVYIRQKGEVLYLVEPSARGGWYSELWRPSLGGN